MRKRIKIFLLFIVFGLTILYVKPVKAQCAACAAAVASNAKSGDTTVNGLNKGILFLLAAPYIAVGAVGYIWYKKYRRKNVNINIRSEKLNLN